MRSQWALGVGVIALLGYLGGGTAWADRSPNISDIVIAQNSRDVSVSTTLHGALDGEQGEVLQSGNSVSFIYRIELLRGRLFWPDKEMVTKVVQRTVHYDVLKKEYIYSSTEDGESTRERRTQSPDEVRTWMTELKGVPLEAPDVPVSSGKYYVRIRAKLIPPKFIFRLTYLLFFWNRSTDWTHSPPFTLTPP
jgi:hypothetical protein